MTNKIQIPDIVVCIGTGSSECDQITSQIASDLDMPYNLILDSTTLCQPGVYHTSVYDIKLSQIKQKLDGQNAKVILLDVPPSAYNTAQDYAETMLMFNTLSSFLPAENQQSHHSQWYYDQLQTNKVFCVMPFIGVWQVDSGGSFCCHMPKIWSSNIPNFFSQRSKEIRQQILQGQQVSECQFCYNVDNNKGHSDRKLWSYDYGSKFSLFSQDDLAKNTNIKFFHLNLDNQCNLLCRMCNPHSSNLIAKEYQELKLQNISIPIKQKEEILDPTDFEDLEELIVTGGEPTINRNFLDFLKNLKDEKKSTLGIMISTNAAVFNQDLKLIINQFPRMQFAVSIDGFGDLNYYIRWPSIWEKVENNIKFLQEQNKLSHFNITVSIYNINHLYEFYHWVDQQYPEIPCFMKLINNPTHQVPWNYPNHAEVKIGLEKIKKLKIYNMNQSLRDNISYIEEKLNCWNFDVDLLEKFYTFNNLLDNNRQVYLKDYNRELADYCHEYFMNKNV